MNRQLWLTPSSMGYWEKIERLRPGDCLTWGELKEWCQNHDVEDNTLIIAGLEIGNGGTVACPIRDWNYE